MPMIAASTAAAFLPSASPAALPSITTSTFSPTPAPTESIASSTGPRGVPSERQRLHQQQLRAFELPVLLRGDDRADDAGNLHGSVRCSHFAIRAVPPALSEVPVIHDADDRGVAGGSTG